jgi:hypothetical protein
MGDFMKGAETGELMLRDTVAREFVIRSNMTTECSMLSDDEVLTPARTAAQRVLRLGRACGLGAHAQFISSELQNAVKVGKSKSLSAYEVCRKELELYSRECGIGKLLYIMNSRLRRVKVIHNPTRAEYAEAVTESCGDLSDFVRLVWEGLNFEFPETLRRELVICRGVEVPETALESYRESVGKLLSWSLFSSFTEKREEAEDYGRAYRGGVPVMFELRSALCPRLRDGTYLQHPFAVSRVEAVTGNTVKLVEVELLEPARVTELPGVIPRDRGEMELHRAAECGDVRAIMTFATRPEFINARDADSWTPLMVASAYGEKEAVKARLW